MHNTDRLDGMPRVLLEALKNHLCLHTLSPASRLGKNSVRALITQDFCFQPHAGCELIPQ